ncbi:MAG: efflux RND transporter permease subunit [Deltaproteobacteria bacterium]|nr:efflux RND transporter permease subunit [Deltaproteobacteria bacterium]
MSLSSTAVRRPVLTTMVFVALLALGAVSFTRLQVDLLPELDFPSISVVTTYEGAGPEEIETLITRPMEQAVASIEGIDRLESFSAEGRSRVALRFVWGTNLDVALNDVRAVVEQVKAVLPEEVDNPVVFKFNLGSFPILHAGLSGELDESSLRRLAERDLLPRLERVEGVAAASVRGGLERQIHVLLQTDRLQSPAISPQEVVDALRSGNRNVPAEQGERNVLMRTVGEAESIEELQSLVVTTRMVGGSRQPIHLRDVATVVDSHQEMTAAVYINGRPGIRIAINKQSGANTVEVCRRVREEIERINADEEGRARLDVITDTSEYIEASINNVQTSVLIGAGLAVLVLFFFLRNLRSTIVVAIGIPISVIGIFTLMYQFDITLNLVSFGGLALGIGMLVDNTIVILENIFRKLEGGHAPFDAAIEGSREVGGAIVASTMTTVVVFLPVIFLAGFAAIFFGQMAFVVSFALLCSLAVALTLVPVLSSRFLSIRDAQSHQDDVIGRALHALDRLYGRFVDGCLARPKSTLLLAALLTAAAVAAGPLIGTELMPEDDQSDVRVDIELPTGTRLEITEEAARKLSEIIVAEVPELESMQTVVGTPGFWSRSGEEAADIDLSLTPPSERKRSSEAIAEDLRKKLEGVIPGGDLRVRAGGGLWILRMLRGGGERLEVQIRGFDLATGDRLTTEAKERIEKVPGVSGVRVGRRPGGREVRVLPDRDRIASMGLRVDQVSSQLQTLLQGTRATVLRAEGDEFPVVVKLPENETRSIQAALDLPIVIPGVGPTPMRNLVQIEETEGPLTIERFNQRRVVDITAILSGERDLGDVVTDLRASLREIDVPPTFSIVVRGETEEQEQTFRSLLTGILLAIALVYMVMAAQFESFRQPFLIMFSIPFAVVGVVAVLLLTGTTFNIQSFMGCIVLIGVVVNNAIVLVDYVNLQRREHGLAVREAVALSARRRLRPILMTTATTILALLPVAAGFAEGGETQAPLARVVIGGLLTSTAISLIIIPVLYDLFEGRQEKPKPEQVRLEKAA